VSMIDCGAAGMANAVYISRPHHMGRSELRPAGVKTRRFERKNGEVRVVPEPDFRCGA
jgi:hypothetical protein